MFVCRWRKLLCVYWNVLKSVPLELHTQTCKVEEITVTSSKWEFELTLSLEQKIFSHWHFLNNLPYIMFCTGWQHFILPYKGIQIDRIIENIFRKIAFTQGNCQPAYIVSLSASHLRLITFIILDPFSRSVSIVLVLFELQTSVTCSD